MAKCDGPNCANSLTGSQRKWCSDACKMAGHRADKKGANPPVKRNKKRNKPVTLRYASLEENESTALLRDMRRLLQETLVVLQRNAVPGTVQAEVEADVGIIDIMDEPAVDTHATHNFLAGMADLFGDDHG